MKNKYVLFLLFSFSFIVYPVFGQQDTRLLKGTVIEKETKSSLPGVNIQVKGKTTGTITDLDGYFELYIPRGNVTLIFSYIGKNDVVRDVSSTQTSIDVVMVDDDALLSEVVVTGYMSQKKADLTGSLSLASSSDIEKSPSANALKSLQGKLPGVFITGDGGPTDNTSIQIRGMTSLNFASPPLIVIDNQPTNLNMRDINSSDIESIQVLKDAASASIYGARAASGVILIQTKQGRKGEHKISYDGFVGFNKLVNKVDVLNTEEYGRAYWQATVNDGSDPSESIRIYDYDWYKDERGIPVLKHLSPVEWLNPEKTMKSADTDWFDKLTQTGIQTNHQVTISNGSEKSRNLFSLGYYHNEGTQIHTHFTRYSARMNSDYDFFNGLLKVGENFTASYINFKEGNEVENAMTMPSIVPVRTEDGEWGGSAMSLGMDDYNNPVRILTMDKDNTRNFLKLFGNVYLELEPIKNLKLKTQFGIDYSSAYFRELQYSWREGGGRSFDINGVTNDQNHILEYVWSNTALYSFTFGKNNFDVLLGTEATKLNNDGFKAYRKGIYLENRDYAVLSQATGNTQITEGWTGESAMFSLFSKVNYSFDSKYLFSVTLRRDGSSKFGPDNKYGTFPAFSAGWRISEEHFMGSLNWLSDLKARISWGKNGNSNIPAGRTISQYDANYQATSYPIMGNENGELWSGYRRLNIGNPNLKWESTEQTNVGVDFGVLNHKLTGSLDYFYKKTSDMLVTPPYIGAMGEGAYRIENGATMTNKGFEFLLNYSDVTAGGFSYDISLNASTYKNKLTKLPINVINDYPGNGMTDLILNKSVNSIYGLVADGIFQNQDEVDIHAEQPGKGVGRIRYKDLDGDGRIDEAHDRTWIGISDPDFIAGLNFNSQYRNFDLSLFFQGVFGNEVYNRWKEYSDFWNFHVQKGKNHPTRILKAWTPDNPTSEIPALTLSNRNGENRMSTYFIENGSYLKLRTIELGYTFPRHISQKMSMSRLRLYVSARNVFTLKKSWGSDKFTGKDPENPGFGYQIPLSMSFGVNVTF